MTAMVEYKEQELTAYEIVVKEGKLRFEGFANGNAKVVILKAIESEKDFYLFARTDGEQRWRYLVVYRQQDVGTFNSDKMYIPSLEAVLKHCW